MMFQPSELEQIKQIMTGKFGIERENLRVTPNGELTLTPHPNALGDKRTNPEVTTDFSESQLEIISPVVDSIEQLLPELARISTTVKQALAQEFLWMQSVPPTALPAEDAIPLAQFGTRADATYEKTLYREYLSTKYGRYKQLYSGIHFNFSYDDRQLRSLFPQTTINDFYIRLMAQTLKYRFFLNFVVAASPATINKVAYRSARLGKEGYHNLTTIPLDYTSTANYLASLEAVIASGLIEGSRELYELVRAKGTAMDSFDAEQALINRIELRMPDLNPLYPEGINPSDLYVMHLYIRWCSSLVDQSYDVAEQRTAADLSNAAALLELTQPLEHKIKSIFDALFVYLEWANLPAVYHASLLEAYQRFLYPNKRYSEQLIAAYAKSSFDEFNLNIAKQHA